MIISANGRKRRRKSKTDALINDQIITKSLSAIRPSPENDKLYKPINTKDPSIRDLALDIKKRGILDPLVITVDDYILSGHRRYAAAKIAGLEEIPIRVANVRHGDPDFVRLLRTFNRQRVKSLDEVAREAVLDINPEESYRRLVAHRQQRATVDTSQAIQINGSASRSIITAAKKPLLEAVLAVLEELRDYWPLSDRRVHYALQNNPPLIHASKPNSLYRNDKNSYRAVIDILTRGRIDGCIPYAAIADPTRPVTTWSVFPDPSPFIERQFDDFLTGYYRDLQQSQPNHIEIVGEKNTIASTINPVASDYCIPFTIGRGYCSLEPRYRMAQRFEESGKEKLVILVVSDFDPEGEDIPHSFARSMRDDFDIDGDNIVVVKVALTQQQVLALNLPPNNLEAKKKSSRYASFVQKYGKEVYELEAVPPAELKRLLRESVDSVLDVSAFNAEIEAEKQDSRQLEGMRRSALDNLQFDENED